MKTAGNWTHSGTNSHVIRRFLQGRQRGRTSEVPAGQTGQRVGGVRCRQHWRGGNACSARERERDDVARRNSAAAAVQAGTDDLSRPRRARAGARKLVWRGAHRKGLGPIRERLEKSAARKTAASDRATRR